MYHTPSNLAKADLHVHSTCSDGALSPAGVVDLAVSRGVRHVALTDHDTTDGLKEARRCAESRGIRFTPGVELSVVHGGEQVHLLAYDFDEFDKELRLHLNAARAFRHERARRIVERLSTEGISATLDSVLRHAGRAAPTRSHIALALVDGGSVKTTVEAFRTLLSDASKFVLPVDLISATDAIQLIHDAGGWLSLAHPGQWCLHQTVLDLVGGGLDALEVVHPSHDTILRRYYTDLAERLGIGQTGGSDFHGRVSGEEERVGKYCVDSDMVDSWKRDRRIGV